MTKKMRRTSIRSVGFDLDDTLYDRHEVYRKVFAIMEKEVIPIHQPFETFNEVFQAYSLQGYYDFSAGRKTQEEYQIERVMQTYHFFNHPLSKEQALIFHSLYQYFRQHISLRPFMKKTLEFLAEQGIPIFILSNGSSQTQRKKLEVLGIAQYTNSNHFFISEEIGCSKPNQKVFQFVEEQLRLSGREILYIGDSWENDVQASQKCQWRAIHLNITGKPIVAESSPISFTSDEKIYHWLRKNMSY